MANLYMQGGGLQGHPCQLESGESSLHIRPVYPAGALQLRDIATVITAACLLAWVCTIIFAVASLICGFGVDSKPNLACATSWL